MLTANFQLNGRCNQGIIGVYAMRPPGRPLNLRNCAQLLNYRDLGVLDLKRYYLGCNETTEKESEWILKCRKLQRGGHSLEILILGQVRVIKGYINRLMSLDVLLKITNILSFVNYST